MSEILRLLSGDGALSIGSVDGKKTIASVEHNIVWYVNEDFKESEINVPSRPTPRTPVNVFEIVASADFAKIFGALGRELHALALTQHQIVEFVQSHPSWLSEEKGYGTFFLFQVSDRFFVASVFYCSKRELGVLLQPFKKSDVWEVDEWYKACRRLVVPVA
ncbi:MAG: hypothetical protein AAB601_03255 [Patescibacteria group bacterium]